VAQSSQSLLDACWSGCKRALVVVGCFSLFSNLLMLTLPLYMLQIYDRVLASHSYSTLLYLTIIAIVALVVYASLESLRSMLLYQISQWLDSSLSPRALLGAARQLLQGNGYANLVLRDINQVSSLISGNGIIACFDLPWFIIYLVVVYLLHPALGMLATCAAAGLFGLTYFNERLTHSALTKSNELLLQNQGRIDMALRNADAIQTMGMMKNLASRWAEHQQEIHVLQQSANRLLQIILASTKFLRLSLQIGILAIGAYYVLNNKLTPGAMIAASILISRALAPVEQIIANWRQFMGGYQAYGRIKNYFSLQAVIGNGISLPKPKGQLQVERLFYTPAKQDKPVLKNISFALKSGEMLAIIGPSAAGKSTLLKLIAGTHLPTAGSVRLDGAEISHWQREEVGNYLGYLPQSVELLPGTVKENIARLDLDPADDAVLKAAQAACVHELILKLPQGYETQLGGEGHKLSGGQQQRIGLARALYGEPSLLLLDEPNSNLDLQGEEALKQVLTQIKQQSKTCIIITHRQNILQYVDKVLWLIDGQIKLFGPKEQVLAHLAGKNHG